MMLSLGYGLGPLIKIIVIDYLCLVGLFWGLVYIPKTNRWRSLILAQLGVFKLVCVVFFVITLRNTKDADPRFSLGFGAILAAAIAIVPLGLATVLFLRNICTKSTSSTGSTSSASTPTGSDMSS